MDPQGSSTGWARGLVAAQPAEARERFPEIRGWPLLRASDAHQPEDIGRAWTWLTLEEATFQELRLALAGEGGRRVVGGGVNPWRTSPCTFWMWLKTA